MHATGRGLKTIVSADGKGLVSQSGGLLLTRTLAVTGLDRGLSAALDRWRSPRAVHDPGKIIADLAVTLAMGGDCLADIALLRAEPELFGPVASDPVVSRLVAKLAKDAPRALKAIRAAGHRPAEGVGPGRPPRAGRGRRPGDRRPGRDDRDRALGQGPGRADLLDAYGIPPDPDRTRYYRLLYDLAP